MTEPTSNRSDYFSSRLATAAVEIGRLRWALHRVVELAADAPKLTDEQLRSKLLELGSRIRPLNEPAGDVPPAPKWGVSLLDFVSHAVDEQADHPRGVFIARCGHRLLMVTELHDQPPGRTCPSCTRLVRAR